MDEVSGKITVAPSDEQLHDEIKDLRRQIDACIKAAKVKQREMSYRAGRDEVETALLKLKEAKMWCGLALGELGHKLPQEFRDEAV